MMKYAVVFPGQGSQSVGMLKALAEQYSIVEETYAEVSKAVGFDVWKVSSEGPSDALNATTCTQPAMLAAGVSVWRIWQTKTNIAPLLMAGHSLGEYSALVCSGAMALSDAARLVFERAKAMQEAVPEDVGAMAAVIGLEAHAIEEACKTVSNDKYQVWPANYNGTLQTVVAGHREAVQALMEYLKTKGAKKSVLLPVSIPSHCPLMQPAAKQFATSVRDIKFTLPRIPVLHNVDASSQSEIERIKDALVQQLYSPVKWVDTIEAMVSYGISAVIECGPGNVLTGLNRRITNALQAISVYDEETLSEALRQLNG